MSNYEHIQNQIQDFSKKIAIPEYKEFCRKHGLNSLHFGRAPKPINESFRSNEFKLNWQILSIFNEEKSPYSIYENRIINWKFDVNGDPSIYEDFSLSQFLEKHIKLEKEHRQHKKETEIAIIAISILSLPAIFFIYEKLEHLIPDYLNISLIFIFFSAIIILLYLQKYISKRKLIAFEKKVDILRSEIDKIEFDNLKKQNPAQI